MAFTATLAAVLLVGVLSQTSPTMVPGYAAAAARYESDGAFVRAIEAQLPGEASIFQLPYVPFPEGADPGHVGEYEDLFDSLHSNRLRWSGGAMEGRPTDWVPAFLEKPLPQIMEGISALGFSGLYIDREGVSDYRKLLSTLRPILGTAPLTGGGGRFAFFDLAAYNRRLREVYSAAQIARIAEAALHPRRRA